MPECQSAKAWNPWFYRVSQWNQAVWHFGTLFFKLLPVCIQFFIYILFFFIYYFIKNRVLECQNVKNRLKTLINQHFFWHSAWHFPFFVKCQSAKKLFCDFTQSHKVTKSQFQKMLINQGFLHVKTAVWLCDSSFYNALCIYTYNFYNTL